MQNLISQNPILHVLLEGKNLFDQWMASPIPAFGIKQTPDWFDVYFIGDAAVTVPPACGNGLSMAIIGGRLAAEYALRHQCGEFKAFWKNRCAAQLFWAKILHKMMLNPTIGRTFMKMGHYFPLLNRKLYNWTRITTSQIVDHLV